MALRTAHGRARQLGALVVVETLPADELPAATGSDPGRRDRDSGGRFQPGNRIAKTARFRSGQQGELGRLEAKGDPAWQAADRWSKRWARFRVRELAQLHGGELSSEVCGVIEDARQAVADARYCRAKAAELEATDPARADKLRGEARQLRIEVRGHRLAAWELAAREAAARPRESARDRLARQIAERAELRAKSEADR